MKEYSTDSNGHAPSWFFIFMVSMIVAVLLNSVISTFNMPQILDLIIPVFAPFGIFLGVAALYNKVFWRTPIGGWLGVNVPHIGGAWDVDVSSHAHGSVSGNARIQQTWRKISICLEFPTPSESTNVTAHFTTESPNNKLVYNYVSRPSPSSAAPGIHFGTVELTVKDKEMKGYYYTSPERGSHGEINFRRTNHRVE